MPDTFFLDLFSGIGGFSLGAYWSGLRFTRHFYSEVDPYACKVYQDRFPEAEALGDIRSIRGSDLPKGEWIIAGGFPCQDISVAGKGAGLAGARSGLWYEYARLIGELRPRFAIMENVGALAFRGLDSVLGSLAALGYDAEWQDIRASDVGAPHRRERIWIVAYPDNGRQDTRSQRLGSQDRDQKTNHATRQGANVPNSDRGRCEGERERGLLDDEREAFGNDFDGCGSSLADASRLYVQGFDDRSGEREPGRGSWWATEPDVGRVAHGVPATLDGLDISEGFKSIMTYAYQTISDPREVLSSLRGEIDSESFQQWQARSTDYVCSKKVLLLYLCELERRGIEKLSAQEGAQTSDRSLRGLRNNAEPPGTSYRPESEKQSAGEYPNTLQALSRLLAQNCEKAWTPYRWTYAEDRVSRLRCCGNSIVPQIAELIFRQADFDEWRLSNAL